jgi:hypothetical protein
MVDRIKIFTRVNFILASLSILVYALIRFNKNFRLVIPAKGDETSYLPVFEMFISKSGFAKANIYGNSTVYNLVASFFNLFTEHKILSLRITTLFFGFLTLASLWYFQKKFFNLSKELNLVSFLTSINVIVVASFVFSGVNDQIISFLTVLFFILIFSLKEKKYHYYTLGIVLALFFSTRLMVVVLLPSIFYVIFLKLKKMNINIKQKLKNVFLILFAFATTLIVFNYPSLIEKGKLSFHSKEGDHGGVAYNINWSQMQYLAAIGQEKGEIKHNKHYSWKQVREYLDEHGENSLPKTTTEALFFDFNRTIREFFKDFALTSVPFTRLLGVIFPLGLFLFLLNLKKKGFIINVLKNEIFMFFIIYVLIISFIVISNVETRWFLNILIFIPIIVLNKLPERIKIYKSYVPIKTIVINVQLLSIIVMNIPFILKNVF